MPSRERVDGAALLEVVERWRAGGGTQYAVLDSASLRRLSELRAGRQRTVTIPVADRILTRLDCAYLLERLAV